MIKAFKQIFSIRSHQGFDISKVKAGYTFDLKLHSSMSPVKVRIDEHRPCIRPNVASVYKYSFVTTVKFKLETLIGIGEDNDSELARKKSIYEVLERVVFKNTPNKEIRATSNGWAAHTNLDQCKENALFELIERDACLSLFHSKKSISFLSPASMPENILKWIDEAKSKTIFKEIKIGVIDSGFSLVAATIMMNQDGYGVFGFATGRDFKTSILKSISEATRMAETALSKVFYLSSSNLSDPEYKSFPQDHAVYYAHHEKIPNWVFAHNFSSWSVTDTQWNKQDFEKIFFALKPEFSIHCADEFFVGSCDSKFIQKLYFGHPDQALKLDLLNHTRLNNQINKMQPHFVS